MEKIFEKLKKIREMEIKMNLSRNLRNEYFEFD